MADSLVQKWEQLSIDNTTARTIDPRMYEYLIGTNNRPGHGFGQSTIDDWMAKNQQIRDDTDAATISLEDFKS